MLTLLGTFLKRGGGLTEMRGDRINPHETSLSEDVCAHITIKAESPCASSAANKVALNSNISLQVGGGASACSPPALISTLGATNSPKFHSCVR